MEKDLKRMREYYQPALINGIPIFKPGEEKSVETTMLIKALTDLQNNIGAFVDKDKCNIIKVSQSLGFLITQLEL